MLNIILKFITIPFLLIIILNCSRDRIVDPPIRPPRTLNGDISGSLIRENSPYIVTDDIRINIQDSLILEPGTQLFFKSGTYLAVSGNLQVNGQSNLPVIFKSNSPDSTWRGIHLQNSQGLSLFQFCTIEGVSIDYVDTLNFGALSLTESSAVIRNSIFRGNYAQNGGAVAARNSQLDIYNSLFLENDCVVFGGAVFALESSLNFINNTVYGNNCTNVGGGVVLYSGVYGDIQNNLFYQNTGQQGDPRIYLELTDSSVVNMAYNFLRGDSLDPGFISPQKPGQDFHLIPGSVCMDAGNPAQQYDDADGSRNDQGAYGGPGGDW